MKKEKPTAWQNLTLTELYRFHNFHLMWMMFLTEQRKMSLRQAQERIHLLDSQTNKASIGTMANLTTTEKGPLVGAVNELDGGKVNGEGMTLSVNADGTLRVTYDDGQ